MHAELLAIRKEFHMKKCELDLFMKQTQSVERHDKKNAKKCVLIVAASQWAFSGNSTQFYRAFESVLELEWQCIDLARFVSGPSTNSFIRTRFTTFIRFVQLSIILCILFWWWMVFFFSPLWTFRIISSLFEWLSAAYLHRNFFHDASLIRLHWFLDREFLVLSAFIYAYVYTYI